MNEKKTHRLQKFLASAGIGSRRGCEQLIEAFKDMPDQFVLVLLGYGSLWDSIKAMSSEMNNVFIISSYFLS